MTDFYAALGITKNASLTEVKKAYRRLAKTCHPDKVPGKEAQFILIQEAYETLCNADKRYVYDNNAEEASIPRFTKENLRFYLPPDPMQYNHYEYINILLQLDGNERLTPGQKIGDYRLLDAKLTYIVRLLSVEQRVIDEVDKETQTRRKKLLHNIQKIGASAFILYESNDRQKGYLEEGTEIKKLYDFSIGVNQSEEMKQIGLLIGGLSRLKQYIKKNYMMYGASELFVLHKAHLLTPENFSQLLARDEYPSISLSENLTLLLNNNLLTQDRFNLLMKHNKHRVGIWHALCFLHNHQIFNQKYVDMFLKTGANVANLAYIFESLHLLGILNEANLQTVVHKIPHTDVWRALDEMSLIGCITPAHSKALHWSGPKEIQALNQQLENMLAHGLFLLSSNTSQGVRTMILALDLKQNLKEFFEKSPQQQNREKEQFKRSFIAKLHSQDQYMTVHRAFWKVILANVLIAFTGVGLLAISINLALNRRCFFAQTKREQFIDTMEHSPWIRSC